LWLRSAQDLSFFSQVSAQDQRMVAVLWRSLKRRSQSIAKPMSAQTSPISAWAAQVDLSASRPTSRPHTANPPPFQLFTLPEAQDLIPPFLNTSLFDTPSPEQVHFDDVLKHPKTENFTQRLEQCYKV
jgi:hypothetical protein